MLDIDAYTLSRNRTTIDHAHHNMECGSLLDLPFFLAIF